jgi:predicted dehydrogenase
VLKANIIGTGIMGSAVAQVLAREPRATLTAACNRSNESLEKLKAQYPINIYNDYRAMLDAEKPDVVFIATPDWAHLDPVMACLERGIHVYVEKPLTTDIAEAEAITRKVAETGLKLQVSYNHRWLAPYHLTYRKIREGVIGRPLMGYARKNNPITGLGERQLAHVVPVLPRHRPHALVVRRCASGSDLHRCEVRVEGQVRLGHVGRTPGPGALSAGGRGDL